MNGTKGWQTMDDSAVRLERAMGVLTAFADKIEELTTGNYKLGYEWGRTLEPLYSMAMDELNDILCNLNRAVDEITGAKDGDTPKASA